MQQVANQKPLLFQQYHIVSLFIPLVRSEASVSGIPLEALNPYLNALEKRELRDTLGTFLILKTYINKVSRLMDLEIYPEDEKLRLVYNKLRIEELREMREVRSS